MKNITFLLMFLGLLLSTQTYAQIPTVLKDSDFSTKTGAFKDSRDGKYYFYKKYGERDWFMQNLNWNDNGAAGWAGPEDLDGSKYGRFYKIKEVATVCPEGWHSIAHKELGELVINVKDTYNLSDIKASAPNYYTMEGAMKYLRGGGMVSEGGLWLDGTGTVDQTIADQVQFNILPAGAFNGTGYMDGHGIGKRMYMISNSGDRFYNNNLTGSGGYNSLRHNNTTAASHASGYGVVRCVRDAQAIKDQVIIADEIEPKALADGTFDLPAIASSGLTMTYATSNPSVATIDANGKVTIHGIGETTITMTQEGNSEFNPADSESRVLAVFGSKYYVTMPTLAGTLLSPEGSKHMIVGDLPFEFSVTVLSGYEGTPVVKLSSGETLAATSVVRNTYTYEVKGLTSDVSVNISGIAKTLVTGYPRFATISDIHAGYEGWEAKATKALDNLIAQTPKLDAIFITGNITDGGKKGEYELVNELVKSKVPANISVYYAMGNNDWENNAILSGEYFDKTMDQDPNQFIVIRGYPFITISAETKDRASSYLQKTKEFLDAKLKYAAAEYPGKPIFVIQHIPNEGTVYGSYTIGGNDSWGTPNITANLEKYPQVVSISGNSHYFLANERSIYQNKFTAINNGSIAFGRMESGLDGGVQPAGSETITEGCIVSIDEHNAVQIKRVDFLNDKELKQAWALNAPHDGTAFTYKGRTGGTSPLFVDGSKITVSNLKEATCTVEFPAAKDDDDVTQYFVEVLDENKNPLVRPQFKFTSDYYLATSGTVAAVISQDLSRLVENTEYYVRVTAIDAFGQKSTPLLSDKFKTKAIDASTPTLFTTIADRIRADHEGRVGVASNDANVDQVLTVFKNAKNSKDEDVHGLFTDLNYAASGASDWGDDLTGPGNHMHRLKSMAIAYTMPTSKYFESDDLHDKIVRALQYWYDRNPRSSNWWHASIGIPKPMGITLLEMRKGKKRVPVVLESLLLDRMETASQTPESQAGPNRTDVALHYLYRACLIEDKVLLERTMRLGFEPLKITNGEGIQVDNSYFQHNQQFQLGSYGQELMNTSVEFGIYAYDTEYAVGGTQLEILSKFARESFFNVHRGRFIHFNSIGRGVSRTGALRRFGNTRFAESLMKIDPLHKAEYESIYKRIKGDEPASYNIKANNKSYFVGDYVIHTRPEFQFAVRTVSNRTVRSEWGNGEALQTYFMSDGSTSFMQKGDEYENIPVGWNWTRIPGTTAPQYPFEEIPQWSNSAYEIGKSNFVGGVSDSIYSANTYYLTDKWKDNIATNPEPKYPINTEGHKSWFFFDNEIVCLGAGLTSTCEYPLNTSVEQNLLKSDVIVSSTAGEKTFALSYRGETSYNNDLKWVLHNGAGYFFPKGGKVHTENITTTRAWSKINEGYSKDPVDTDVFSLWFDHGKNPIDATYAYIVVPNKKTAAEMNSYDVNNIEILANTAALQVVKNKKANVLQIIFSKAGKFEHEGMIIESDEAAALILKNIGTPEVTMHIADPGQNGSEITVYTLIPSVSPKKKQTVCDFGATGRFAGATKVYTINAKSEDATEVIPEKDPDFVYKKVVLADTYVTDISSDINKNFGAEDKLEIKLNDINGYHRQSYVRFSLEDLDKFTDPDKYDVGVSVEFFVTSANTGIKSTNWVLTPVEDIAWLESDITWNNKPAVGLETIARVKGFAPNTTIAPSDKENRADFNITEYALSEYTKGNKSISLNINNNIPGSKVNSTFASKEHSDALLHPMIAVKLYKKEPVIKTQVITFNAIADKVIGDADFVAGATSSSGLAIVYTSSNLSVATIVEGKIHIVGAGETTITASQAGNEEYSAAENKIQVLKVNKKTQVITFEAIVDKTVGDTDFEAGATSNSGLAIAYTSSDLAVATIVEGKVHIVGVGETTITASQVGNQEYGAAESKTQVLKVNNSPEVSINSVTINGELWSDLSKTYLVPRAESSKTIELKVELLGNNQIVGTNPIIVNVEKPSVQDVKFVVKNGDKTKEFILKVEKRFDFDKITQQKWNNTFIVNNNKDRNGGYKFVSYQWFKNEGTATVGTKQYYREMEQGKANLRVEMITEDGSKLQTWSTEVSANTMILKAYPNPVVSGQVLYLDANDMPEEFLKDASVSIYSTMGLKMQDKKVTEKVSSLEMPLSPGLYLVKVTSDTYEETFKIIVK